MGFWTEVNWKYSIYEQRAGIFFYFSSYTNQMIYSEVVVSVSIGLFIVHTEPTEAFIFSIFTLLRTFFGNAKMSR